MIVQSTNAGVAGYRDSRGSLLSLYPGAPLPLYLFNARRLPDGGIVAAEIARKADQRERVNDPL
jgi:hypothetical protein